MAQNGPSVSACIITYNHEPFIRQTIEGALMQQVQMPYEIVIAEDHSTDRTREICLEYAHKYPNLIRLVLNEKNLGMQGNWVRALQCCQCKYIAMCEGDDYWTDPLKLQKQVDFLEQHQEYSAIHSKVLYVDKNGSLNGQSNRVKPELESISFEQLVQRNVIHTCSFLFRKGSMMYGDKFLWDITFGFHDIYLFLGTSLRGKIKYLNEVTAAYRQFVGITQGFTKESKRKEAISYLNFFIDFPEINNSKKAAILLRLSDVYLDYAMIRAKHNNLDDAKINFSKFRETYKSYKNFKKYISDPIIRIRITKILRIFFWVFLPGIMTCLRDFYLYILYAFNFRDRPGTRR